MKILILTMFIAGFFGGTVNYLHLYSKKSKGWTNYFKFIFSGIAASFLVPLFLQMISSDLVEGAREGKEKELLVFIGFCLVAAIFSRRFIETIGEKILQELKDTKATAESAKEIAETSKEEVELLTSKSTEVDNELELEAETVSTSTTTTTTRSPNEDFKMLEQTKHEVQKILTALKNPSYTFRTLKGISEESEIAEDKVLKTLEAFKNLGLAKEISRRGNILYALTDKGNRIKIS